MEAIELKDFLDFKFLSNVRAMQDHSVVFTQHTCNEKDNTYEHQLMMIKEGKTMPLTTGNKESNFILGEKGDVIFTSYRSKEEKERVEAGEELTCFYRINIHGGEAQKQFEVNYQVTQYLQIDDDHYAMLVNYDPRYSHANESDEKQEVLKRKKEAQDYEEFTRIPFYYNGGGFAGEIVSCLYLYEVSTNQMKRVTPLDLNVTLLRFDEAKQKIYFVANQQLARPSLKDGVYVYDLDKETTQVLLEEKEYAIFTIELFQDGVLLIANKDVVYGNNDNPKFYHIHSETKDVSLFYDNAQAVYNSVGSDCRFGGGQGIKVHQNMFYYLTTIADKCEIHRIDAQGNDTLYLQVDGSVDCFDIVDDTLYCIALHNNQLQEVYAYKDATLTQITHLNTSLEGKYVADYEEIDFHNDGVALKGWVLLPENYDPSKTYPAILDIHGGSKTVYGKVYYHEMQVWANMGYVVFFTNPRGSDGYGSEFAAIYGQYGTIDYDDLMKFTDIVLDKYAIDPKRVGVTGGSYGGFMTNWIVTHSNRFACAATQRSISNWISFYGTSDIGFHFAEDQIHGNIFNNVEKLWDHSPLKYVSNVKTPTLIIHSDEDYRCPLEQGLQFYTALCDLKVETKLVLFHRENHELSRSGLPKHRVKRLHEITNWMENYLK